MNFIRASILLLQTTHFSTVNSTGTRKTTQWLEYPLQWQDPLTALVAATKAEAAVQAYTLIEEWLKL